MKKLILFVLGAVCVLSSCNGQAPPQKMAPLKIGDTVPDVVFHHMLNYKDSTARLSDFEGKLVILDFFATWCSSCIAALPRLQMLQEKFKNHIQIFVVSYQSKNKIATFLQNNLIGKQLSLPYITSDSILSNWFPHKLIPHEVWINSDGTLKATTATDQLTVGNIKNLLEGKLVHLKIKKDVENFSMQEPLLFNKQIGLSPQEIKYYAMISPYIDGIPGNAFLEKDSNNLVTRICLTNYSIRRLYRYACSIAFPDNRCLLNMKDSGGFVIKDDNTNWERRNKFCYELSLPATTLKKAKQKMLQDLVSCFGYHAAIKVKDRKCLVLTAGKHVHNIFSKGGTPRHNFSSNSSPKYMKNQPLSQLVYYLNYTLKEPVIDETHINRPVDLQLPEDLSDTEALTRSLKRYGLELSEKIRPVKVFILSDH